MERRQTRIEDGTLFVESDDGWLAVGALADVYEVLGGDEFTIEYDERQRTQAWLDTDEEGRMVIDVRETLAGMSYRPEFVRKLEEYDLATERYGLPERTVVFAERMAEIWESKGNLDTEL